MGETLRAPFPWFGGKSRAAALIWERFGCVPNYVEPFAGSLAVMLGRPGKSHVETCNDLDCYVANFWRSTVLSPQALIDAAQWPINEADLHARHRWLIDRHEFRERMLVDPHYHDARIAGWWLWGIGQWLGAGWCAQVDRPARSKPKIAGSGNGIHASTPLADWIQKLKARLARVRVCCGDWSRVLTPSVFADFQVSAVLLDPPYSAEARKTQSVNASGLVRTACDR